MILLYTIKDGDTLARIAKRYYGDYEKFHYIAQFNDIDNPDKIYVGQAIKLPDVGRAFRFPLDKAETSYYHYGTMYSSKSKWAGRPHPGVDFHDYEGAPVYAIGEGVVRRNAYDPGGYGRYVMIEHTTAEQVKVWTLYAHLADEIDMPHAGLKLHGENIVIGHEGMTGGAGLPHLHFEVKRTAQLGLYSIIDMFNLDKYFIEPYTFIRGNRYLPVE